MDAVLQEVAVKMESVKTRHPQLLYESKLYKLLQGGTGIPHVRHVCVVRFWLLGRIALLCMTRGYGLLLQTN